MHKLSVSSVGLAILMMPVASMAMAQAAAPLDDLRACRLDAGRVALSFTYEDGACVAPQPAAVDEADTSAVVTISTNRTAEVCTLNIVPVEVNQPIVVSQAVQHLDITVLDPEGTPRAAGSAEIEPMGADCAEPPVGQ